MVNHIVRALAKGTPALRERYLERVRAVPGPEARELEAQIRALVDRDRRPAAA